MSAVVGRAADSLESESLRYAASRVVYSSSRVGEVLTKLGITPVFPVEASSRI